MASSCTSKMETSFTHLASMLARFTQGVDSQMEEALKELPPHILISTDSLGNRDFERRVGGNPIFLQERGWECDGEGDFPGKWLFMEGDIVFVMFASKTSGSSIEAALNESGFWDVILTVPIEDGVPYKGCYWAAFWGTELWRDEAEMSSSGGFGGERNPPEPDPRPEEFVEEVAPPPHEEPPAPIARVEDEEI